MIVVSCYGCSELYDTAHIDNPTLLQVLTTPGANTYGGPSDPYGLNAFNATGAFLTNSIPGYQFSLEAMQQNNESQSCPIDHHGNFKNPFPTYPMKRASRFPGNPPPLRACIPVG